MIKNKIFVVGDVMLDKNIFLNFKKKSAEANINYYTETNSSYSLGGAANTTLSLKNLELDPILIFFANKDEKLDLLKELLKKFKIKHKIFFQKKYVNIIKNRFYFKQEQIFRFDKEQKLDNFKFKYKYGEFLKYLNKNLNSSSKLVISDYNKGVVTNEVLNYVKKLKDKLKFKLIIDTKKTDPKILKNITYLKQNKKENYNLKKNIKYFNKFLEKNKIENYVLTKADKGLTIYNKKNIFNSDYVKVTSNNVNGAGDAITALLTYFEYLNIEKAEFPKLLNLIGAILVTNYGNCVANLKLVNQIIYLKKKLNYTNSKVVEFFKKNKKIGFTNGCFDILHKGHLKLIRQTKKLCDVLVVGLNSDSSVKKLKGKNRPYNNILIRKKNLSKLNLISKIETFNQKTPIKIIQNIFPDVLVKGGDYKKKEIIGSKLVKKNGGKVVLIKFLKGFSTTKILKGYEKKIIR